MTGSDAFPHVTALGRIVDRHLIEAELAQMQFVLGAICTAATPAFTLIAVPLTGASWWWCPLPILASVLALCSAAWSRRNMPARRAVWAASLALTGAALGALVWCIPAGGDHKAAGLYLTCFAIGSVMFTAPYRLLMVGLSGALAATATPALARQGEWAALAMLIASVVAAWCIHRYVAHLVVTSLVNARRAAALATTDPLTGLANRRTLSTRLGAELDRLDRGEVRSVAVLLLDLDDFKPVNDTRGHLVGDGLLVAVADRFRAKLGDADTIARLGGDEFAVIMTDADVTGTLQPAVDALLDAARVPVILDGVAIDLSASIGVAIATRTGTTPNELVHRADLAMYEAKRRGRDRAVVFDEVAPVGKGGPADGFSGLEALLGRDGSYGRASGRGPLRTSR